MKVHKLLTQFLFSSWTVVNGSCLVLDLDFRCQAYLGMYVRNFLSAPVCLEIPALRFPRIYPVVGSPKYGLTFSWISLVSTGTCVAAGDCSVVLPGQLAQRELEENRRWISLWLGITRSPHLLWLLNNSSFWRMGSGADGCISNQLLKEKFH